MHLNHVSVFLSQKMIKTIVLSMPIKQKSAQHDLSLKHQEWLKENKDNLPTEIDKKVKDGTLTIKDAE